MSAATFRVRDARDGEHEAIRELTLRAYREYAALMTPSAWAGLSAAVRSALDSTEQVARIVAAREGGTLVGSVLLYPPAADAYAGATARAAWPEVRLLAVAPEARGHGVGRRLMEECIRRARAAGAGELGLHTSVSMRAAIRLYTDMGFVRDPDRDFHPPGAELVEAYRLPLSG